MLLQAASMLTHVRLKLEESPDADRLLAILDGEVMRDTQSLSRIFGEELPSDLSFARLRPLPRQRFSRYCQVEEIRAD
jgi:hypothetical protein